MVVGVFFTLSSFKKNKRTKSSPSGPIRSLSSSSANLEKVSSAWESSPVGKRMAAVVSAAGCWEKVEESFFVVVVVEVEREFSLVGAIAVM